jgi:hypothetical protein
MRLDSCREVLSEWVSAHTEELLDGVDAVDFEGPPIVTGAVLVVRVSDGGVSDSETLRCVSTPGLGPSARIGMLHWALEEE